MSKRRKFRITFITSEGGGFSIYGATYEIEGLMDDITLEHIRERCMKSKGMVHKPNILNIFELETGET